ncbi:hypothetical protein C8F01DRAFT_1367374 [Mycena amicta]|nr:hypothetical protein C8F01DRAFT_1367374 [Mycena amicta]
MNIFRKAADVFSPGSRDSSMEHPDAPMVIDTDDSVLVSPGHLQVHTRDVDRVQTPTAQQLSEGKMVSGDTFVNRRPQGPAVKATTERKPTERKPTERKPTETRPDASARHGETAAARSRDGERESRAPDGDKKTRGPREPAVKKRAENTTTPDLDELRAEIRSLKEVIQALQLELEKAPPALYDLPQLQDGFGITADLTSVSDIRRRLADFDAGVEQIAATLADAGTRAKIPPSPGRYWSHERRGEAISVIGDILAEPLMSAKHAPPDMIVQIAIQAGIAVWARVQLFAWVFGNPTPNKFWMGTYAGIREIVEEPEDASRWRAMTRKNLLKHIDVAQAQRTLVDHLVAVLSLCRYSSRTDLMRSVTFLEKAYGERIGLVVRSAEVLNREIGTLMISADLEAVLVPPGTPFSKDVMQSIWEDSDQNSRAATPDAVVCTVGLGLAKKVPGSGHNLAEVVIVKPKVFLTSDLKAIMETS